MKALISGEPSLEFEKEIRILSKLAHVRRNVKLTDALKPHIAQYLGIFMSPTGDKFIVSEYMEKGDLRSLLVFEGKNWELSNLIKM